MTAVCFGIRGVLVIHRVVPIVENHTGVIPRADAGPETSGFRGILRAHGLDAHSSDQRDIIRKPTMAMPKPMMMFQPPMPGMGNSVWVR